MGGREYGRVEGRGAAMQFHRLAKVLPGPQVLAFLVRLTSEVPRELLHECPRSYSQTPDYCEAANKAEKVKKTFNTIYICCLRISIVLY